MLLLYIVFDIFKYFSFGFFKYLNRKMNGKLTPSILYRMFLQLVNILRKNILKYIFI